MGFQCNHFDMHKYSFLGSSDIWHLFRKRQVDDIHRYLKYENSIVLIFFINKKVICTCGILVEFVPRHSSSPSP